MLVYISIYNYIDYKEKVEKMKIGYEIWKLAWFSMDVAIKKWDYKTLTGDSKKMWSKYKPELLKKWKWCFIYRVKLSNIMNKEEYEDMIDKSKLYDMFYIKWDYNSRKICGKEDYENCNIYMMEKWIKVYDDDYECK